MGHVLMPGARIKTDPCGGCGQKTNAVYPGPLCQKCWGRVAYEAKAAYVQAEATGDTVLFGEARGDLLYEARLAYRMTILMKLWRKTWKRKFKAKYKLEHEAARIQAKEKRPGTKVTPERAELVFD